MQPAIVYLMGPTCSGKSRFVEAAKIKYGPRLGLVEVGKAFRAKYPASYFKGQANPAHTAAEALQMYEQFLEEELIKPGIEIVLVDGQPRQGQVEKILATYTEFRKIFIHLDASVAVRTARIKTRFPRRLDGTTSEDEELAVARIQNDLITYYDVLVNLLKRDIWVCVFDTDRPEEEWTKDALKVIDNLCFVK